MSDFTSLKEKSWTSAWGNRNNSSIWFTLPALSVWPKHQIFLRLYFSIRHQIRATVPAVYLTGKKAVTELTIIPLERRHSLEELQIQGSSWYSAASLEAKLEEFSYLNTLRSTNIYEHSLCVRQYVENWGYNGQQDKSSACSSQDIWKGISVYLWDRLPFSLYAKGSNPFDL